MMPQLWTLQTQYLAFHPVALTTPVAVVISVCFAVGWSLNHYANDQKNLSRRTAGRCRIWGQEAKVLKATYQTADGKTHQTVLLCSGNNPIGSVSELLFLTILGWWGVVRHANYVGSMVYTWASCAVCGTDHVFPYTEALLVTCMVIHRCLRDEARCKEKYGETWDEYCRIVRWRMIPGIF
jgi:7-dehydrocholesterol reductase